MPMKRTGAVSSAVVAIAIGMVMLRGSVSGPAISAPPTQTRGSHRMANARPAQSVTEEARQPLPEDGPWQASRDHFAGVRAGECASLQDAALRWCIPQNEKVQAMVAIVPDPLHTHMALNYDRSLEAIQLAAESMNYVSDRYWLPWDPSTKLDWGDYNSQHEAQAAESEKEKQPGLLLFRWNGETDKGPATTLYVFIVSETSTAGVNGVQFRNALNYRSQLCGQADCVLPQGDPDDAKRIRILGPTSSGSLASLVRLTQTAHEAWQLKFKAYSGTVSSICALQNQHLAQHSELCDPVSGPRNETLAFNVFVSDTESSMNEFVQSLMAHDINCSGAPQVALLFEAATTYGAAKKLTEFSRDIKDLNNDLAARCATSFSYPREISSLRNAHNKGPADAANQGGSADTPYLSFTLADREPNMSDEPPEFSKPQGPLAKEAVLMKLAGELKRNQYKYIGLSGSNVLDVLFLAGFLRNACPDARLFVVNADLLFERTLDNAAYIGTLGVATYPMVARDLDWTSRYANLPRLPFPDQYEEGQYNAFLTGLRGLISLRNAPQLYEFKEPFGPGAPSSSEASHLPLWLTVVGAGGYWPVRLLHPNASIHERPALKREDFSAGWKIMLMLLCALAVLHLYLLETVSPISKTFRDFALVTAMPAQRLFFIHVASATLSAALDMMVMPVWNFGWQAETSLGLIAVVALLVIALFLVFWLAHHLGRITRSLPLVILACVMALYFIKSQVQVFGDQAGSRVWSLALIGTFLAFALPLVSWRLHAAHLLRQKWMQHAGKKDEHSIPQGIVAFLTKWLRINMKDQRRAQSLSAWGGILMGLLVWTILMVLGFFWLLLFRDGPDRYGFFFAYRSLYLATGVAPFIPMLPLLATMYCWSILEIWRLRFNDRRRPRLEPELLVSGLQGQPGTPFPGQRTEKPIAAAVSRFFLGRQYVLAFCVIFYCWLILFDPAHPFQSFEDRAFSWVYAVLFIIGVGMMLSSGLRLWAVWSKLRDLLRELERGPLRLAFSRVKGFSWSPIWRQGGEEADWINMARSLEVLQQINHCETEAKEQAGEAASVRHAAINGDVAAMNISAGGISTLVQQARQQGIVCVLHQSMLEYKHALKLPRLQTETKATADQELPKTLTALFYEIEERFTDFQQRLAMVLQRVMEKLREEWETRRLPLTEEAEPDTNKVVVVSSQEKPSRAEKYFQELEEYAALRYVAFIRGVLTHIRYLIIFLGTSFSLVLLSLNIYSFEPHQTLIWSFTAIFILVGVAIVTVLAQIHKDHVLSRITGTKPNELGFEFYLRIASFGAVPLLTFVATHFPSIGHYLVSFLQPGLESLK